MSYVVLELRLSVGYFMYFKFTCVFFYLMSLLQLKKNWLISKGMLVLLFDVFNGSSLIQLRK